MAESSRSARARRPPGPPAGGGDAVYALGLIGAVVYFWQQADTFWERVVAILKAAVWPAFLVYEAFQSLLG